MEEGAFSSNELEKENKVSDLQSNTSGPETEPYEVRLLQPEDAPGVAELFRAVYGEGYPIKLFYDPEALIKANERGDYYTILARTASGKVIAADHLFQSAPNKSTYEWGAGLAHKEWRGRGVYERVSRYTAEVVVPKLGMSMVFGEPVCNHLHLQKKTEERRFVEMALEIALMPAEQFAKEASAAGRVATMLVFRTYKPRPHTVFIPDVYREELRFLYSELDDGRDFASATSDRPGRETSLSDMTVFDFAQVARIAVHEVGFDFDAHISGRESEALARNTVVFQAWLKLSAPEVGFAVDALRNKGYFIGGILPQWFEDDGIFMQKLLCPPNFQGIKLYSQRAAKILEFEKADREKVSEIARK